MSINLEIRYSDGVKKAFEIRELPGQPIGDHVFSLWDFLELAGTMGPGLTYVFDSGTLATDRGGLEFPGTITSVDGLEGDWVVRIDGVEPKELRRAALRMASGREVPRLCDGNAVVIARA